jgi:ParB family chromosome partitioning protein
LDDHLRSECQQIDTGWDKIDPYLENDGLSRAAALRIAKGAHVSGHVTEDDWYTPAEYIEAARAVMGAIDLDPASTAVANAIIGAATYYGPDREPPFHDGLLHGWHGRVWMNPPFSRGSVFPFCDRLAEEVTNGNVAEACALVNNATETAFFQRMAEAASALCFPHGRISFWHPERSSEVGLQGQAIIYFGPHMETFRDAFTRFGFTVSL